MPKIKYGLKNCYYAKATISTTDGSATYATPQPWKGAVNLSMDREGDQEVFYADNIAYYISANNGGYTGSFESALIPDDFRTNILGETKNTDGVLIETVQSQPEHFAFLFQFEHDNTNTKHVLYNCTSGRPAASGATKNETIEVQTETLNLDAKAIYNSSLQKDIVKASTAASTDSTTYASWTTAVYQPTA